MTVANVHEVAQAFHDGVANKDIPALLDLYGEDARFLPPDMEPAEGRAQIEAAMQRLFDMGASSLDVEPIDTREAGDLTVEYGRYTLGIEAEGQSLTQVGKYVVVHEAQDDGSTKILFDCFNANGPPS
jgi:ketosteroid isomerase-like protein